jgi:VanZ family protein
LFPGSILGYFFYKNLHIQPQITKDFIISSNHFYVFFILSTIGILAYRNTNKIKILINFLLLLSIILEFLHIIIPNRSFEWIDLFGNIMGVVVVVTIYKIKKKYE